MLKLYSFLPVCKIQATGLRCFVHNQLVVKYVCSEVQRVIVPACSCNSKNRLRNCSTYTNSISTFQVSYTKEIADRLGLCHDTLMNCVVDSPSLLSVKPLQWEKCFKELVNNGFTAEDSLAMVIKYPPLLIMKSQDLSFAFQVWRSTNLGEKYVLSLIKSCPHFLFLSEREVATRIPPLRALGTRKGVVDLLKNSPNIMLENWNNVVAKLSFLKEEMRIEDKYILKSYALNRSMMFLKTRFVFLERCGKYAKPKLNADNTIPSKNPPLSKIIEGNDEDFATIVAGVTLEEYEVFQDLFAMEVEDSESTGSDSE